MLWFSKDPASTEYSFDDKKEVIPVSGVEFKSDNGSSKLPYKIVIDGEETDSTIRFLDEVWQVRVAGLNAAYFKQEHLESMLAKVKELNAGAGCCKCSCGKVVG